MAIAEGIKYWSDNEAVRGFDANAFLMSQSVMRFESASDRDVALAQSLTAGMVSYDKSTSVMSFYNGSTWQAFGTTADLASHLSAVNPHAQYLLLSGGTLTGELVITGSSPQMKFNDAEHDDFWIHVNANNFYILPDRGDDGSWETPYALQLEADTNTAYTFGNRILTVADEGSGNGLDADTLDGSHASAFAASSHTHSYLPLSGGTVTGDVKIGSDTEFVYIDFDDDQQLELVSNTTNGRPFIAFFNKDASGSLDRKGYLGYPDAASDASTINIVSEQGPLLLRSAAGNVLIRPDRYVRFEEDGDTTGAIVMDMSGNPKLTIQNDAASTGDYIQFSCDTTWSRIEAGQQVYINQWIYPDPGVRTYDSGTAAVPVYSWREDTDTGMYRHGANDFRLVAGGNTALVVTSLTTVSTAAPSTSTTSGYNYVLRNLTIGTLERFTSCREAKEQITSFTDSGAIIDQLRPVTFIPKFRAVQEGDVETPEQQQLREVDINYGFIAEEIGEVANGKLAQWEWTEDGQLKVSGWKWPDMIAVLTAEVQSLRARIAQLETA